MSTINQKMSLIQSTAGAVPVKNEKGQVSMQKVKVKRYVSGKRPDYAPDSSDEEDEDLEVPFSRQQRKAPVQMSRSIAEEEDPRLRRLKEHRQDMEDEDEDDRISRHRHIMEPEIVEESGEEMEEDEDSDDVGRRVRIRPDEESSSDDEELEEDEIEKRRSLMRMRAQERAREQMQEELLEKEDEGSEKEELMSESSEYESYSDSEDETGPRLKPVFVAKKDRVTVQEREVEAQKIKELELKAKKLAEDRKLESLRLIESEARRELEESENVSKDAFELNAIVTDDENDEEEYEAWKVRELKRLKRDKEEKEQREKEQQEVDRLRNMTEEERRKELHNNPKTITNKADKGRYKFLQKYYHRGAFFMDEEEGIFKRDYSKATLDDHFDKTVLPKVMQVKNFGRSGRTKYTHLLDQDTTQFDSPWNSDSVIGRKFQNLAGGMKQSFGKPTSKKSKDSST
ncbi:microfibrillar-associated protein 1-like [Anneissia japonica]|uniref:microfibrillar-associated protein 1-like n=1 Tax=Anneissia japonica TaxID=1529436 RepID=UPI001425B0F3|nr:microfibrillar-associated protein 1-like [Anneissia japonica]